MKSIRKPSPYPSTEVYFYNLIPRMFRHLNIFWTNINRGLQSSQSLCNLLLSLVGNFLPGYLMGIRCYVEYPPSVLRNAHAECIPSFSSPVVFFSSRVLDLSEEINVFMSLVVESFFFNISRLLFLFSVLL